MPRGFYVVTFENISVTAAQDLFEGLPADDKPFEVVEFGVSQFSDTDSEQLRLALKRLTATVTSGSGGASVTPLKTVSSDAAAGSTWERNNTTRATTTGATEILIAEGINVLNGWKVIEIPEGRFIFVQGEACILGLEAAPVDALSMNGYIKFKEVG